MSSKTERMTPERWARLQQIFDAVMDLPRPERGAYLDRVCANDPLTRGEVEALMASSDSAEELITDAIHDAADQAIEKRLDATGQLIGPYRILRTLGHGGMGAVYLAERADRQFHQQVAIKVVTGAVTDKETDVRFRAERQILASLDHPNIARLIDGGNTEAGVPYLVMEYIEGRTILKFCDEKRLDIDARIDLFRKICAAVHYAHQNLVVHRDLKPGNILVTDEGVPKLLDFGIAKILDTKHIPQTVAVTRAGDRLLTPEHASPEQILGRQVTTASDIYSLGVLLYELLTGRRPYQVSGIRPGQMERLICEQIPEPASRVFSGSAPFDEATDRLAAARSTTAERLRRRLVGDLDNIVLVALRKEPERRYSSINQFSEDLRRHRAGMTVHARPDTWLYRTEKFVRRHKVGVAMAVASVLAVIGFGIAMALQAQRIAVERDLVAAENEKARQVTRFLIDMFKAADPWETLGNEITAREILDIGARRVAVELNDQPELQARLMDTVGQVYLSLSLYDQARAQLEQAHAIRLGLFPERHPDVAGSLHNLALLNLDQGQWRVAEESVRKALDISRELLGPDHEDVAAMLHTLGRVYQTGLDLEAAERTLRQSMDMYARLFGDDDLKVASVMNDLAQVLRERGDLATAEQLLRRALEIGRARLNPDHPELMLHVINLALVRHYLGDLDTAEALYREALDIQRRVLGEDHAHIGLTQANLGRLLLERGDTDEAERFFIEAMELDTRARGADSFHVGYHHANLGQLYTVTGDLVASERHFRRALAIYAATQADERVYEASAMTGLGRVLVDTGAAAEAVPLTRTALERWRPAYDDDHWQVWATRSVLGAALAAVGETAEAEVLLADSHAQLRNQWGTDDHRARWAGRHLAALYVATGRARLAQSLTAEP